MSPEPPATPVAAESFLGRRRYLLNIVWSWMGAGALIVVGLLVPPFLIRRIGSEGYGVWALALSFVEYFWLIDLGFRPATVKYAAEYRALNRTGELNRLVSTALGYSGLCGTAVLLLLWFNAERIATYLKVAAPEFPALIRVIALSWAFGLVFNVFGAVLEGFQRFDLTNAITIGSTLARSVLVVLVVWHGYGLWEMGIVLAATQAATYVALFLAAVRIYPEIHLSPRYVTWEMARQLVSYGRQVFSALLGARLLQAGIPALIAYFLPVRHVTYYTVSQKILDYVGDVIGRIGLVTSPRASAWMAQGDRARILRLSHYGNTYCLALWALPASFLFVFSENVCRLWVNAEFAGQARILLPVLIAGYTLWMGQFISASILMGIARYEAYALSVLAEAVLVLLGCAVVLPRFGIAGAATVFSVLVALNRSLNLSRIFCREFDLSWTEFVRKIYPRPLLLAVISILALHLWKRILPGNSWTELFGLWALHCTVYGAGAAVMVLWPDHRALVRERAASWRRRILPGASRAG